MCYFQAEKKIITLKSIIVGGMLRDIKFKMVYLSSLKYLKKTCIVIILNYFLTKAIFSIFLIFHHNWLTLYYIYDNVDNASNKTCTIIV